MQNYCKRHGYKYARTIYLLSPTDIPLFEDWTQHRCTLLIDEWLDGALMFSGALIVPLFTFQPLPSLTNRVFNYGDGQDVDDTLVLTIDRLSGSILLLPSGYGLPGKRYITIFFVLLFLHIFRSMTMADKFSERGVVVLTITSTVTALYFNVKSKLCLLLLVAYV